jgi:acyl-CoA thioester hydrolase
MDGLGTPLLCTHTDRVLPDWIDYNGHMNVAYYVMLLDRGADAFFGLLGIDTAYVETERKSTFALDARIVYRRELIEGNAVRCLSQLFDYDEKRVHVGHYLAHAEEGWTAAFSEWVYLHVDMRTRRAAPFPSHVTDKLGNLLADHKRIARPVELSRPLGLARPSKGGA